MTCILPDFFRGADPWVPGDPLPSTWAQMGLNHLITGISSPSPSPPSSPSPSPSSPPPPSLRRPGMDWEEKLVPYLNEGGATSVAVVGDQITHFLFKEMYSPTPILIQYLNISSTETIGYYKKNRLEHALALTLEFIQVPGITGFIISSIKLKSAIFPFKSKSFFQPPRPRLHEGWNLLSPLAHRLVAKKFEDYH